ncbi:hypothetical protein LP417_23820 [Polaromonas sp. P1-6]|nr:hypothetical protein LP417_23820 [Polaromonas sp. P1-6]
MRGGGAYAFGGASDQYVFAAKMQVHEFPLLKVQPSVGGQAQHVARDDAALDLVAARMDC